MMKLEVEQAMCSASCSVLETMFFSDAVPVAAPDAVHDDPIACLLHCSGAQEGTFSVAIDQAALHLLGCAFYGEDEMELPQQQELICELTNMLAGSTLSTIAPTRYCELSSPQLSSFQRHTEIASNHAGQTDTASTHLRIDGGILTVSCSLRTAA